MDILLITLLTLLASAVGTVTGFGTSTIMVPVLLSCLPLPQRPARRGRTLALFSLSAHHT
jgi:uncharacterized membrane protein YfcA